MYFHFWRILCFILKAKCWGPTLSFNFWTFYLVSTRFINCQSGFCKWLAWVLSMLCCAGVHNNKPSASNLKTHISYWLANNAINLLNTDYRADPFIFGIETSGRRNRILCGYIDILYLHIYYRYIQFMVIGF